MKAKAYTDNQLKWMKQYTDTKFVEVHRAVGKVETTYASDKASANEFRGQLKDQANTFVTRRELWGAVVTIIAIVVGLLSYFK